MKFKGIPSTVMEKHVPKEFGLLMWCKFILILHRFDLKYLIKDIETIKGAKEILWKYVA